MNTSIIDVQKANTAQWRNEFLDLRFPEFDFSMPDEEKKEVLSITPGNIVMFPEFDFSLALIVGFHRSGTLRVIPVSPHSAPSMEFEIKLSESAFVLQTWNSRLLSQKDITQIIPIAKLSPEDLKVAVKHYKFTFDGERFSTEQTGQSLSLFVPEDEILESYIDQQYHVFPEDIFIITENVILETDEIAETENSFRQDLDENTSDIIFPGSGRSCMIDEQKAASKNSSFDLDDFF
jgi:hypothetical protein